MEENSPAAARNHLPCQASLGQVEVSTKAKPQSEGLQNLWPTLLGGEGRSSTSERCALVESLRKRMEELQKEVIRLSYIGEREQELENYSRHCKNIRALWP